MIGMGIKPLNYLQNCVWQLLSPDPEKVIQLIGNNCGGAPAVIPPCMSLLISMVLIEWERRFEFSAGENLVKTLRAHRILFFYTQESTNWHLERHSVKVWQNYQLPVFAINLTYYTILRLLVTATRRSFYTPYFTRWILIHSCRINPYKVYTSSVENDRIEVNKSSYSNKSANSRFCHVFKRMSVFGI